MHNQITNHKKSDIQIVFYTDMYNLQNRLISKRLIPINQIISLSLQEKKQKLVQIHSCECYKYF